MIPEVGQGFEENIYFMKSKRDNFMKVYILSF